MATTTKELKAQLDRIESKLDRVLSALADKPELPEPQPTEQLDIIQAAEVLAMTLDAVRKHIKMIPHTEVKGKFYFKENELLAYIESDFSKSPLKSTQKASTRYIGFDYKEWLSGQMKMRLIANRDKAILADRAKQAKR